MPFIPSRSTIAWTTSGGLLAPPIQPVRIGDKILDQIRERLTAGKLLAGDRLPSERYFAEQLGVSRNSVREALRVLEALGVVTIQKGHTGGAFVSQGDPDISHTDERFAGRLKGSSDKDGGRLAFFGGGEVTPVERRLKAKFAPDMAGSQHRPEVPCRNRIQNGKRCRGASRRCAQGPDLAVPADIFRPTGCRWP